MQQDIRIKDIVLDVSPVAISRIRGQQSSGLFNRFLEQSGLILRKKDGRTNFVALRGQVLRKVQTWITQYHTEWGSDEASLENYISGLQ